MKLSLLPQNRIQQSLLVLLLGFCISTAWAIDLNTAKAQGLVGERNDGYLGYVVTPPSNDVKALVKEVNSKRKSIFTNTAKKNNITAAQVANRFYERAVNATASGRYYQDSSGKWVKK